MEILAVAGPVEFRITLLEYQILEKVSELNEVTTREFGTIYRTSIRPEYWGDGSVVPAPKPESWGTKIPGRSQLGKLAKRGLLAKNRTGNRFRITDFGRSFLTHKSLTYKPNEANIDQ